MNMDDLEFDWDWWISTPPQPPFERDPDTTRLFVYIQDQRGTYLGISKTNGEEFTDEEINELVELGINLCNARYPS